jgi:hypothetical protein
VISDFGAGQGFPCPAFGFFSGRFSMKDWRVALRFTGIGILFAIGVILASGCNTGKTEEEKSVRKAVRNSLAPGDPQVVVEYEGRSMEEQEIREEYGRWNNVNDMKEFRDRAVQLAISEVLSRKAFDLGLERKDFEYQKNINKFVREYLFNLYVERVIDPKIVLTEEDFRKEMKDQEFMDTVNIRVLMPEDPLKIEEIQKEIREGRDFFALMKKYGTETGKKTSGNIGFISLENTFIPDEDKKTVFEAKEGSIVGPVETFIGKVFVLLEEKYTAKEMYELAKKNYEPSLVKRKAEEIISGEVKRLKKKHKVTVMDADENEFQFINGVKVRVVARVGDTIITDGELTSENEGHHGRVLLDRERKLAKILGQILFAKEAESIGLDQDPKYRKALQAKQREELFAAYKFSVFQTPVKVTTTDLEAYYRKYREEYFYKYPEASYAVFKNVREDLFKVAMEQARTLEGKAGIENLATRLNVSQEIVLRRRMKELPGALRKKMESKQDGEVFEIPVSAGLHDVYRVIHMDKEEQYPKLEEIRDEVERSYRNHKMVEQLNFFLSGEIEKVKVNEDKLKELYEEYRNARMERPVSEKKSNTIHPALPHSKASGSKR